MKKGNIYLSTDEIHNNVVQLSRRLRKILEGRDNVAFVIVLHGAIHFASDLLRELNMNYPLVYVRASSYKGARQQVCAPKLEWLEQDIVRNAKTVVILEDIVDTGTTIQEIIKSMDSPDKEHIVVSMLSKQTTLSGIDNFIYAVTVPEELFLFGYGLDEQNNWRHMNSIVQKGTIYE